MTEKPKRKRRDGGAADAYQRVEAQVQAHRASLAAAANVNPEGLDRLVPILLALPDLLRVLARLEHDPSAYAAAQADWQMLGGSCTLDQRPVSSPDLALSWQHDPWLVVVAYGTLQIAGQLDPDTLQAWLTRQQTER